MSSPISKLIAIVLSVFSSGTLLAMEPITGAGSSAAYPVFKSWADQLRRDNGYSLNYSSLGSSSGIEKVRTQQVDFGATDVAPKGEQLTRENLVLFPTVIAGVVPVVNLPRMDKPVVLDGPTLAGIFLGEITRWDAPEIRALNPGLSLPGLPVVPVVRGDGSGTTYNFADYLSKVSPAWKQKQGTATSLKWPSAFVAVNGSKGMAEAVRSTAGAIGYVDYNYVVEYKLGAASLKNAEGVVVEANPSTFHDALVHSSWMQNGDFTQTLTNQAGRRSWPITMGIFAVLPRVSQHPERTQQVARFFTDAFMRGDELTKKANFVRLPSVVQGKAFRALAEITDSKGNLISVSSLK